MNLLSGLGHLALEAHTHFIVAIALTMEDEWNDQETIGLSFGRGNYIKKLTDIQNETTRPALKDSQDNAFKKFDRNSGDDGGGARGGDRRRGGRDNDYGRNNSKFQDAEDDSGYNNKRNDYGENRNRRDYNKENGSDSGNHRNRNDRGENRRRYNNDDNSERQNRSDRRNDDNSERQNRNYRRNDDNSERQNRNDRRNDDNSERKDGNDRFDRRGGDNGKNENGEEITEKPKERYIPPEPSTDEAEIFGSGITSGINFNKYETIPVEASANAEKPISSFEMSNLKPFLLTNIKKSGYTKPTPIQKTAIPSIMAKKDLMGCAQTGSGKTAAFLLPIIHDLLSDNRDLNPGQPHALVVSPTRELAIQIQNEAHKFALGSFLKLAIAYGGTVVRHQRERIARGCHILVCTPGRLLDFVEKGDVSFESVRYVVLDEADRMLDLGFIPAVQKIMDHPSMAPKDSRQTLMFSATFPEEIQKLAAQFLDNYVYIAVGRVGGACTDVEQHFYELKRDDKRPKLLELLKEFIDNAGNIMVFVETKRSADFLASFLSEAQIPTTSIHGDRYQSEREEALKTFKMGSMKVLVATSVCARGLDIKNVSHVINFDLPNSIDEYVHRIGRTGRLGNKGIAVSFYDPFKDQQMSSSLVKMLNEAGQSVPSFLTSVGDSSGFHNDRRSAFGGRDIRNNRRDNYDLDMNSGRINATSAPDPQEPDEEWN